MTICLTVSPYFCCVFVWLRLHAMIGWPIFNTICHFLSSWLEHAHMVKFNYLLENNFKSKEVSSSVACLLRFNSLWGVLIHAAALNKPIRSLDRYVNTQFHWMRCISLHLFDVSTRALLQHTHTNCRFIHHPNRIWIRRFLRAILILWLCLLRGRIFFMIDCALGYKKPNEREREKANRNRIAHFKQK